MSATVTSETACQMSVLPAQHFVVSDDGHYFSAQPVPLPTVCQCNLTGADPMEKHKRDCPTRMPKLKKHDEAKPPDVKCEPAEVDHCEVLNAQSNVSTIMAETVQCDALITEPSMPIMLDNVKCEFDENEVSEQGDQSDQGIPDSLLSTPSFSNSEKKYVCNVCGKACDSKGYRRHVLSHSEERPFVCSECGDSFAQNSALQRHIMSHTGEKPFICQMCGEGFKVNYHLKRHYMTHTGIKPFTCAECGEKFSRNSHLKRHAMIHTGEKPFPCTQCGKRFLNNNHLKRHYLTHTGEKPHVCTECGERFSRGSHLKRHLMLHSGEKPFSCDECGQMFIHLHALRTHHLTHSSDKPFACDVCGKRFMDDNHLKRHLTTHETQMFVPLVTVKNPYDGDYQ